MPAGEYLRSLLCGAVCLFVRSSSQPNPYQPTNRPTNHPTTRVFAIYQLLLCWRHINIVMKPTNSPPTPGRPNPRRIRSKVAFGPFSFHSKLFFVGSGFVLFYIENRLQETQRNQIIRKHPNQRTTAKTTNQSPNHSTMTNQPINS